MWRHRLNRTTLLWSTNKINLMGDSSGQKIGTAHSERCPIHPTPISIRRHLISQNHRLCDRFNLCPTNRQIISKAIDDLHTASYLKIITGDFNRRTQLITGCMTNTRGLRLEIFLEELDPHLVNNEITTWASAEVSYTNDSAAGTPGLIHKWKVMDVEVFQTTASLSLHITYMDSTTPPSDYCTNSSPNSLQTISTLGAQCKKFTKMIQHTNQHGYAQM